MRILMFIFSLFFAFQTLAFSPSDLRAFGKAAPIQIYLFTSLGCPYCADFHKKIFPTLKKEYADTGKAQIIIVDMIHGGNSLLATQAVRCLDVGKADKLEDELYANQSKWLSKKTGDAKRVIASYSARQGMSEELFDLCLTDQNLQETIIDQQANLSRLYGVSSFPTLIVRDGSKVYKWSGADKKIFKELKEVFQK